MMPLGVHKLPISRKGSCPMTLSECRLMLRVPMKPNPTLSPTLLTQLVSVVLFDRLSSAPLATAYLWSHPAQLAVGA